MHKHNIHWNSLTTLGTALTFLSFTFTMKILPLKVTLLILGLKAKIKQTLLRKQVVYRHSPSLQECTWCQLQTRQIFSAAMQRVFTFLQNSLSSIQFKTVFMQLEKSCISPCLSETSPMLPLNQFQCLSEWWWPFLVPQGRLSSASSFSIPGVMVWYSWLCACR